MEWLPLLPVLLEQYKQTCYLRGVISCKNLRSDLPQLTYFGVNDTDSHVFPVGVDLFSHFLNKLKQLLTRSSFRLTKIILLANFD